MWRTLIISSSLGLLAGCSGLPFGLGAGDGSYNAEGQASYYGAKHQGQRTASGERFDQHQLTAAHRTLPFGTKVRVTNLNNDKSVLVRINDRGPFARGRIVDLSRKAAQQLDMLRSGVAPVRVVSVE
jgi:rare lipoprotein A